MVAICEPHTLESILGSQMCRQWKHLQLFHVICLCFFSFFLGCYVEGEKTFRRAGAKWHPYVPPFGFSPCAVCECNVGTIFCRFFQWTSQKWFLFLALKLMKCWFLRQPRHLQATTLKVNCTPITCPSLSCPEIEAFRPDRRACCKVCPSKWEKGREREGESTTTFLVRILKC